MIVCGFLAAVGLGVVLDLLEHREELLEVFDLLEVDRNEQLLNDDLLAGAALAGAFTIEGMNALRLAPGCAGCAAAVIFAAGTSSGMSSQLLRLVSSDKNSIVSTSPAAGEYTLRFLVYLAILSACAIAEAALRCA